ncbi:pantoate--beta-alanine ligase [Virgibacillus soli]|uniref:pantoate--beta-alanine ligase n=1 Tax=Lederbergia galactosidilytica TaxID=217031 RepID=UPI0007123135|nr:pantoate--beta-alanine ligase [Lederbergia galactosidilytica]KRG12490.1 pantoate--beta-alanine ligase [Virgibacillus soli]MBP1914610.1 pantoate--beta-alanine ligase [Lederbergia galactosidilytica]
MKIFTKKKDLQEHIQTLRTTGKTVGFVPTMGFLHEGHLKLVEKSVADNDCTVMSIFVNPLQFGPKEDFHAYPKDHDQDQRLAENAGVNILFMPDVAEMYSQEHPFRITVLQRTDQLCGKSRPGHFDGVATILIKLFHIVHPQRVYFGLKDAQQISVVDSLIEYFEFPIELIAVETVREQDGLARSSRNVNLTNLERKEAPSLYKALQIGKQLIDEGEKNIGNVIEVVSNYIEKNTSGKIDYIDLLSFPELQPLQLVKGKVILAIAIQFSQARLIDNIILNVKE